MHRSDAGAPRQFCRQSAAKISLTAALPPTAPTSLEIGKMPRWFPVYPDDPPPAGSAGRPASADTPPPLLHTFSEAPKSSPDFFPADQIFPTPRWFPIE